MINFNAQENKVLIMAKPYVEKEYLRTLGFLRTPMILFLKMYICFAVSYIIGWELGIFHKKLLLFKFEIIWLSMFIITLYERNIAFQIINKLRT